MSEFCKIKIKKGDEYWHYNKMAYGNGYFWGNSVDVEIKKADKDITCHNVKHTGTFVDCPGPSHNYEIY